MWWVIPTQLLHPTCKLILTNPNSNTTNPIIRSLEFIKESNQAMATITSLCLPLLLWSPKHCPFKLSTIVLLVKLSTNCHDPIAASACLSIMRIPWKLRSPIRRLCSIFVVRLFVYLHRHILLLGPILH